MMLSMVHYGPAVHKVLLSVCFIPSRSVSSRGVTTLIKRSGRSTIRCTTGFTASVSKDGYSLYFSVPSTA